MHLLYGPKKTVTTVLFSADGCGLFAASSDLKIRLWDLSAGRVRYTLDRNPAEWERAVALSPDRTLLATGDRGGVKLWDVETAAATRVLPGPESFGFVSAVSFTPDGREVVAGGFVGKTGRVRGVQYLHSWNAASGLAAQAWGAHDAAIVRLAFAPDGRRLATQSLSTLTVWDVAGRRALATRPAAARHGTAVLLWASDGSRLIHGTGAALFVLDPKTLTDVTAIEQEAKHFQAAAYSTDGRMLATVSNEETVKLWDTADWQVRQTFAWRTGKLKCVGFAADGLRLAAGGEQGQVVVWDVEG